MKNRRAALACLLVLPAVVGVAAAWRGERGPVKGDGAARGDGVAKPVLVAERASAPEGPALRSTAGVESVRPVGPPPPVTVDQLDGRVAELAAVFPRVGRDDLLKLEYYCPADADRDDAVTSADVAAFVALWMRGDGLTGHLADLTGDRQLDRGDLEAFLDAYFSGSCDPQTQRDHRAVIC